MVTHPFIARRTAASDAVRGGRSKRKVGKSKARSLPLSATNPETSAQFLGHEFFKRRGGGQANSEQKLHTTGTGQPDSRIARKGRQTNGDNVGKELIMGGIIQWLICRLPTVFEKVAYSRTSGGRGLRSYARGLRLVEVVQDF